MKGSLSYTDELPVSTDFEANTISCIFDASQHTVDSAAKKDWRGTHAASGNIMPSLAGATSVADVVPDVKGQPTGM
eukprot:11165723-Lingulodinium_polyedra.AAC.1